MKMQLGIDFRKFEGETWTSNKEKNPIIVETAGFIPLEVKMKRFEQAGIKAQFSTSDFDSQDYRDMYLNPDVQIYPSDELEVVEEKLRLQRNIMQEILHKKQNSKLGETVGGVAGDVQPSQNSDKITVPQDDTVKE